MITNNWYNIFKRIPLYGIKDLRYVAYNGSAYSVSMSGVSGLFYNCTDDVMFCNMGTHAGKSKAAGVIFGSGTTPPTVDDYMLGSDIITNLGVAGVYTASKDSDGAAVRSCRYTITNNNAEAVTISEVGYMGQMKSGSSMYALLDHTLLDEPVTIPAGGVGQVIYTITINPPTF